MRTACLFSAALLAILCLRTSVAADSDTPRFLPSKIQAPMRAVDISVGESTRVTLADGATVRLKLISLQEDRDRLRQAVREARATVELNGAMLTVTSATYHLPVTFAGVQIDCPITHGYIGNSSKANVWGLHKDARFRLWPTNSAWLNPGTFIYPVKQRWFASDTQMANEPTFVNGEEVGKTNIYYHYGLDFGGAEGLVEVVAATDGLVVSAANVTLPEHSNSPAKARYDVIYVIDGRGWYYRYSHLKSIEVKAGQSVRMGQRIGLLGKEGASGGWSHLHFDITSRQPSGDWGIQDAYAYAWEAWRNQTRPALKAVARPHHFAAVGEMIYLDAGKSWSAAGNIASFQWTLSDGATGSTPRIARRYATPGHYSEVLKIVDSAGNVDFDFAVVQVVDPAHPGTIPLTIHAAYHPTTDVRAGDPVTFKVRSFGAGGEETWDFGDGTPPVRVKSDGNAKVHAADGYAVTVHRYEKPGRYLARVHRVNERGEKAQAHLVIEVKERLGAQTTSSKLKGRAELKQKPIAPPHQPV